MSMCACVVGAGVRGWGQLGRVELWAGHKNRLFSFLYTAASHTAPVRNFSGMLSNIGISLQVENVGECCKGAVSWCEIARHKSYLLLLFHFKLKMLENVVKVQ